MCLLFINSEFYLIKNEIVLKLNCLRCGKSFRFMQVSSWRNHLEDSILICNKISLQTSRLQTESLNCNEKVTFWDSKFTAASEFQKDFGTGKQSSGKNLAFSYLLQTSSKPLHSSHATNFANGAVPRIIFWMLVLIVLGIDWPKAAVMKLHSVETAFVWNSRIVVV